MTGLLTLNDDRVHEMRAILPATGAGIYLDTATAGPFPAETARALAESDEWELRVGRGGPDRAADADQRAEEARAVIAALLGVGVDEITLTSGVQDGIARARELAGSRRLEVVTHVDAATGALWDGGSERAADVITVLDAGYSAGAIPVLPEQVGVDAVALAGHRWLLGPEGVGALWVGPRLAEPASDAEPGSPRRSVPEAPPRRALLGLARSVGWLEMYVGLDGIFERTDREAAWLRQALAGVAAAEVLTPAGMAAIVTFRIGGWDPHEAAEELSHRVGAIVGIVDVEGMPAVRASVGWWNTRHELERFADAVDLLARHEPGALPRRPGLVILRGADRG